LNFLNKQFKKIANKQPPCRTLLPHTNMHAPLVKNSSHFRIPKGYWQL